MMVHAIGFLSFLVGREIRNRCPVGLDTSAHLVEVHHRLEELGWVIIVSYVEGCQLGWIGWIG